MTNERAPRDDRWVARAGEGSAEARAGALLRHAAVSTPVDVRRLTAIRERLRETRRRPPRRRALRFAIAVGLLLSGGALTAAAQRYLHLFAPPEKTPVVHAPAPVEGAEGRSRRALARRAEPSAPDLEPAASDLDRAAPNLDQGAPAPEPVVPAAAAGPVASPAAAVTPRETPLALSRSTSGVRGSPFAVVESPPAQRGPSQAAALGPGATVVVTAPPALDPAPLRPSAPVPSALARESKLLAEALQKLRQEGDARGALALLDEHDARFAVGALAPEARLARIEALLKTGQNADALALLDGNTLVPHGSGRALLIARAELRAAAARCPAATADFESLLRRDRPLDVITERALWGRAACRAAAGDPTGARDDLRDYLVSFPSGRFAGKARVALGQ